MSPKAHAGQENFRLIIKTGLDLIAKPPTEVKILYRLYHMDRKDKFLEWDASILDGAGDVGKVYHDFSVDHPVPAAGFYDLRVHLTIDGKNVPTGIERWEVGE